jgi:thiol-disulfide isomerase/thioredoxin
MKSAVRKTFAAGSSLACLLALTACSGGGLSKANENAFIAGNGVAVVLPVAARKPAPALIGTTLDGQILTNKYAAGKVTVVNVWASWCAPCRAEAPLLSDFSSKNPQLAFIGILTRDNLVAARSFEARFGIKYPSLIDDSVLTKFDGTLLPNAIPTTLVIDNNGRVAARISGETTVALLQEVLGKVANASFRA